MLEQWKTITGFANYEVSNQGRVRRSGGKILSISTNPKGYSQVTLYTGGKQITQRVHVLVAKTFIPNPLSLPEVNHIEGDQKDNCAVSNLEWRSGWGNKQHASQNGLGRGSGVRLYKRTGRWVAEYSPVGKRKHLGYFATQEQATQARQTAMATLELQL